MFNFGVLEETLLACQLECGDTLSVRSYLSACHKVFVSFTYIFVSVCWYSYYERISMDSLIKSKINTLQTNSNLQSTLEASSLDKDCYLVSTQVFLVSTTAMYYLRIFARYSLVMSPRLHGFDEK